MQFLGFFFLFFVDFLLFFLLAEKDLLIVGGFWGLFILSSILVDEFLHKNLEFESVM